MDSGGPFMEFFEKKEPNRLHRITEWAVDCAVMIALACYLVFCFGSRVEMNGSSMKPVLESGDVVLINRLAYDVGKPVRFLMLSSLNGKNSSRGSRGSSDFPVRRSRSKMDPSISMGNS